MRIAVAQTPGVRLDQWRETLALIADLIRRARRLGAELVVLPECVWPAYCLGSEQAYRAARAAGLPTPDEFLTHLQQTAHDSGIAVCAGYVEERDGRLFNAAGLVDATGKLLGVHRKCFLWDFDHDYFSPGESIEPVESSFGRVGLMICADARLPEIPATLAAKGVNLIVQPTGWVNIGTPEARSNPQPEFLIPARAAEFGVPFASASKWGVEGGTTFVGSSLICDAEGAVLTQCGQRETTVAVGDVELTTPRSPELTESERAALLSVAEPRKPRADLPPIEVRPHLTAVGCVPDAPCRAGALEIRVPSAFGGHARGVFEFRGSTVTPTGSEQAGVIAEPTADPIHIGEVLVGTAAAADARRFGALRRLALQGVHIVVVFGAATPTQLLRTRACENRVFVLGVGLEGWCVIDPRGQVTVAARWPASASNPTSIILDVALAAEKNAAPRTDLIAARCPDQYFF
ncbi:MAG: hypothetical protein KAY37_07500 [Phycisphaerae bacterium]|nr:hypothetical protein [Phycisphaerae bacterium]